MNRTTGAERYNKRLDKIFENAKRLKQERAEKNFEIKSICREDLIESIGERKAMAMSDEEMKNIAGLMGDYFMNDYWNYLDEALSKINRQKN